MRPLNLVMTGFETYCDRTEIDFTKLGTKGLYLITGETGAGKTTIFDAITFALYGLPSGETRSESMLRSHFATEDIPTEVQFTFEANGKIYKIVRNPEYLKKKERGEGVTPKTADATLTFEGTDKTPVTGKEKVTAAVTEILNLGRKEFCCIAMIAQGAFQKLLLEKTEEKQKIFRELFNTDKYDELQKRLKEESLKYKRDLEAISDSISQYLSGLDFGENEPAEFENLKKSGTLSESDMENLKGLVLLDETNKNRREKEEKKLIEEKKLLGIKVTAAEEYADFEKQLKAADESLEKSGIRLEGAEKELTEARKKETEVQQLTKSVTLIENSLPEYEETDRREAQLRADVSKAKVLSDESELLENEIEKLNQEASEKEEAYKKLSSAGEKKLLLEADLSAAEIKSRKLQEIQKKLSEYESAKIESENGKKTALRDTENYETAAEVYRNARSRFYLEQAGLLADSLEEEKPCPVCGSIHHPAPAKKSSDAPTEQEVNSLEEKMNVAQAKASKSAKVAGELNQKVVMLGKELDSALSEILEGQDKDNPETKAKISDELKLLSSSIENLKKEIEAEDKNVQRKTQLEKEMPELKKKLEAKKAKAQEDRNSLAALNAKNQAEEKSLKDARAKLEFESRSAAEKEILSLNGKIEAIKKAIEQGEKQVEEINEEINRLKGTRSAVETTLSQREKPDTEKLLQLSSENTEKLELAKKEILSLTERIGKNKDSVNSIGKILVDQKALTSKYNMISALSDACNGQLSGKDKLSLEIFVQCAVLDRITKHANKRLMVMSNRQYELRRREESSSKAKKFGLDLDVYDHHTGKQRGVESLSGGEQFQASLSLALGLADEIQNSSGGIRLDSMFIDEGFGTLDTETLDKAMRALDDLSRGEKIIGIISHVSELEEKIDRKIEVSKDSTGKSHLVIKGI